MGEHMGGYKWHGCPTPNMVAKTRHVSKEAGFEHHLPAHGNPCHAASKPTWHLRPAVQITLGLYNESKHNILALVGNDNKLRCSLWTLVHFFWGRAERAMGSPLPGSVSESAPPPSSSSVFLCVFFVFPQRWWWISALIQKNKGISS